MKNIKENKLLQNTIMLYILQFSTYFFSLVTVPYQTRVLGPAVYGTIGVALAVMTYFQLFMDFGFILSATEDVSKHRNDRDYLNRKLTSITILKTVLAAVSILIMSLMCIFIPQFHENMKLYLIYIVAYAINAFIPDYMYRGIEQMGSITVRTVLVKAFFTAMIFLFLKSDQDYLIMPILLLIGNLFAVIFAYVHLNVKLGYKFTKVTAADLKRDFKRSLHFFYSRIATTVYSTANTVIMGFVDSTGILTGYYTSADKILSTAKNGLSPISDSLYPYMIKNKDFKLVKKVIGFFEPIIILGCLVVGIFSKPLCIFVFGKDYAGVAPVLCAMLPAVCAILPSFILGFPTLGAMGLSNYANISIIAGTITHIVGLTILFFTHNVGAVTLAAMTSVSEWAILIFRAVVVYQNRDRFNKEGAEKSKS